MFAYEPYRKGKICFSNVFIIAQKSQCVEKQKYICWCVVWKGNSKHWFFCIVIDKLVNLHATDLNFMLTLFFVCLGFFLVDQRLKSILELCCQIHSCKTVNQREGFILQFTEGNGLQQQSSLHASSNVCTVILSVLVAITFFKVLFLLC